MYRDISLSDISDNKLYSLNDICKVDTNGCKNCCNCCTGMDDTVILDPLDLFHLSVGLSCSPEILMGKRIDFGIVDGFILPHLKFDDKSMKCSFLTSEGRCGIHAFRPGICRIFPLGRYYHDNSFDYFLQIRECSFPHKTKTKIWKWIDFTYIKEHEKYVCDWHYFLKDLEKKRNTEEPDNNTLNDWNLFILKLFFFKKYISQVHVHKQDVDLDLQFYKEFYERLEYAKDVFDLSSQNS